MTISSETARVQYTSTGNTGFDVTFRFLEETDLAVYSLNTTSGTETTYTYSTDFSVTGAGDASGGRISFGTAPTANDIVTIIRDVPLTQETDLVDNDPFSAEVLETALDKLCMTDQALAERIDRCFRMSPGSETVSLELPIPSGGLGIGWNSAGTALTNIASLAGLSVSAFWTTGLSATDAATSRAYLGVATGTSAAAGLVELATASEDLAGTATDKATTPAGMSAHVSAALAAAIQPRFDCQLTVSSGKLQLSRFGGTQLFISGDNRVIPSTGLTLAATGLTTTQTYYVYATASGGTVNAIATGTTAHSIDATYGHRTMTGDDTKTLVGMARPVTGPAWADSITQRMTASFYNRRMKTLQKDQTDGGTTTSASDVEYDATGRMPFVIWSDEGLDAAAAGEVSHSVNSAEKLIRIARNGVVVGSDNSPILWDRQPWSSLYAATGLTEGYHYLSIFWSTSAGTATMGAPGAWGGTARITARLMG